MFPACKKDSDFGVGESGILFQFESSCRKKFYDRCLPTLHLQVNIFIKTIYTKITIPRFYASFPVPLCHASSLELKRHILFLPLDSFTFFVSLKKPLTEWMSMSFSLSYAFFSAGLTVSTSGERKHMSKRDTEEVGIGIHSEFINISITCVSVGELVFCGP